MRSRLDLMPKAITPTTSTRMIAARMTVKRIRSRPGGLVPAVPSVTVICAVATLPDVSVARA